MQNRLASRTLPRNIGALGLAIVLSVAVWVLANVEMNPEVTAAFSSGIPIEVTGLPKDMVVYGTEPGVVNIKIRAPQDSWSRLRAGSFTASVDVSTASAGLREVDINVVCGDPRVRVLEMQPSRVSLRLEPVITRTVPVHVRALDEAPIGYTMMLPHSTPAQVTVTGAAPLAQSISEAYVEVRLDGSKVSFARSYQPILRDAQNREVKGVQMAPSSVEVEVPIDRLRNYKTVSLKAVITGTVAPGYWISGIVVQPSAVTFGGDPQVLESFGYVETGPVDVSGAITEVLKSVSIYIPPGTALDKKEEVFVKVSVQPITGGGIVRRSVSVRNVTVGLTATVAAATVDIRLDGPLPLIQSLKLTDIVATVDASGLFTGTYTLPISVSGIPTGTQVLGITPDRIGVSLK